MGLIIAGFPCIGKTTLVKNTELNIVDLASTKYKYLLDPNISNLEQIKLNVNYPRNPEWPENYIRAIQEAKNKYDIIFVLGKYDFNLMMLDRNIEFSIAYPDPTVPQKDDYIERAKGRNNSKEFIEIFSSNYEKWQAEMNSLPVPKIKLQKGEYIGDALIRMNIYNPQKVRKVDNNYYDER